MKMRPWCAAPAAALSLSTLALAAGLASCAKVTVRKVPTPTQYTEEQWTKQNLQAKADAMEGVRFYLPRPFVSVFESFPIGTDIYIAHGTVSADGQYVYINNITPLTTRVDVTRPASAAEVINFPPVPAGAIFVPGAWDGRGDEPRGTVRGGDTEGEGGKEGDRKAIPKDLETRLAELERLVAEGRIDAAAASDAAKDATEAAKESKDASASAAVSAADARNGTSQASQTAGATGRNTRTVTNSNGAFAYTPLRGNFDIVYLPDFEEQYVVSSQANLGNASFMMNMGQGWSLQGFNSISDNSELNKRIFALIDKASELASLAADAGMAALFPPAGVASAADRLATLRGGDTKLTDLPPGTPVSLKVVVVHYAAKGLYPVIKPRELKGTPQSQLFIDLYAARDNAGNLVGYNAAAIDRAIDHYDQLQRRFTVPVYPYQYISFNTFRYVSIEALTPEGSGYGDLYDKTGTAGDPGDRQAADLADLLRELLKQNFGSVEEKPEVTGPKTQSPTPAAIASSLGSTLRADVDGLGKAVNDSLGRTAENAIKVNGVAAVVGDKASPQTFKITVTTTPAIAEADHKTAQKAIADAILKKIKPKEGEKPGDVATAITSADQLTVELNK